MIIFDTIAFHPISPFLHPLKTVKKKIVKKLIRKFADDM